MQIWKDKDYFVLTTNVDHCFQKAGFDKHRLFYTQGDYGLLSGKWLERRAMWLTRMAHMNTPGIIKYPFWQMTAENPKAVYACLNYGEAVCPKEIAGQAICIDGDIGCVLERCVC